MQVLVTLSSLIGNGLGPNFVITSNGGLVNPNIATKSQLISGYYFDVPNSATQLTITSVGTCSSSITLAILGIPTTTTSTSSTTSTSTTSTTTKTPTTTSSTSSTSTSSTSSTSTSSTSSTTSTSSSTSTSTSSSTSTTSTTTICCNRWSIEITQADIDDAVGNTLYPNSTVYIKYNDCRDSDPTIVTAGYTSAGIQSICSCTVPQVIYYKNDTQTLGTGSKVNNGPDVINCPKPTTSTSSTTSTTTVIPACKCYKIYNTSSTSLGDFTAINCNGQNASGILNPSQEIYRCLRTISVDPFGTVQYDQIFSMDAEYVNCTCMPTTTSTSSTSSTSSTTTSTTTCSCVEDRQVIVSIPLPAVTGFIKATLCNNTEQFIPVDNGLNTVTQCIKLGTIQGLNNVTIVDQTGGLPCC